MASPRVNTYVTFVIAAGALALALGSMTWAGLSTPVGFAVSLAAAVLLPPVKLRLPGLEGNYSGGFLPVLWALTHFGWAEALVIACTVALSQSYLNAKKRPTLQQALFNLATLGLTVSLCHWAVRWLRGAGFLGGDPGSTAALVFTAALYFAFNTAVVSGVLALVQRKPLRDVAGSWYNWSLPYHLVGAAGLSLLVGPGQNVRWESALVIAALLALIQFYCSITDKKTERGVAASQGRIPLRARLYVAAVIALAAGAGVAGFLMQGAPDLVRLTCWTAAACVASICKVRVPGAQQTVSLVFVVLLAGVAELTLVEIVVAGAVAACVQCLWRPARKARPIQVGFSMAALALSAAIASIVARSLLAPALDGAVIGMVAVAAVCFYCSNTALVSLVLCLITGESFDLWKRCHFWVFAYHLVGGCGAALMLSAGRAFGWPAAIMIAPALLLVFVSYRLQVNSTAAPSNASLT